MLLTTKMKGAEALKEEHQFSSPADLLRPSSFQVYNFIVPSFNAVLTLDLFTGLFLQAENKFN